MGPVPGVLGLVQQALGRYGEDWDGKSDQTLFIRLLVDRFVAQPGDTDSEVETEPLMIVDHHQEVFGNTGGRQFEGDMDVRGGRLHNRVTDTHPVVLHCPGHQHHQIEMYALAEAGLTTPIRRCGT